MTRVLRFRIRKGWDIVELDVRFLPMAVVVIFLTISGRRNFCRYPVHQLAGVPANENVTRRRPNYPDLLYRCIQRRPIPPHVNSGGRGKKASACPSQAVAAGIFQINTAVSTFRRLVDAIGTAKDTPDHRQKLSAASASEEHLEPTSTRDQHRQPFLQERKRQEVLLLDNEISFNEAIIEEREHGIREIEEQIGQANEIFKDPAVLVHEQGVVIGSIV
ncbi:unnamed protein product [Prunus armeniaca]